MKRKYNIEVYCYGRVCDFWFGWWVPWFSFLGLIFCWKNKKKNSLGAHTQNILNIKFFFFFLISIKSNNKKSIICLQKIFCSWECYKYIHSQVDDPYHSLCSLGYCGWVYILHILLMFHVNWDWRLLGFVLTHLVSKTWFMFIWNV